MDDTIQVTTKNPKKVEQGKKLAEFNKKQKEELKKVKCDNTYKNVENENTCKII